MKSPGPWLLYRLYRTHARLRHIYRLRVRPGGSLVLALCAFSAVFGVQMGRTDLSLLFSLLFSLLGVSAGCALLPVRMRHLEVRRLLPRMASAGTPCSWRILVRNTGTRVERDLYICEVPEFSYPDLETFLSSPEPGEQERNWFDRRMMFRRWQWLLRRRLFFRAHPMAVPDIPPGREVELRLRITPKRRGILRLEGILLLRPDPLGLFFSLGRRQEVGSLTVIPRRYPAPAVTLGGGRRLQQGGVGLAMRVGDSQEFVSLRDYRPGDPPRTIHWRTWARVGRPVVKEFQDEYFTRYGLVLDTFVHPQEEARLEEAVSAAASIACAVGGGESLLDLLFVERRAWIWTGGRGLGHEEQMLAVLAAVGPSPRTPEGFQSLRRLVLGHAHRLSAAALVLVGWDEERRALVRGLRVLGKPLVLLVVAPETTRALEEQGPGCQVLHLRPGRLAEDLAALGGAGGAGG